MPTRFSFLGKVRAALLIVGLVLGATASAQQNLGAVQQREASSLLERKADLEVQKLGFKKLNEDFVSWKKLNEDLQQRKKAALEVQKLELEAKKLDDDLSFLTPTKWVPILGGILVAFISGGLGAYFATRLARKATVTDVNAAREKQAAELDKPLTKRGCKNYQGLVKLTSPFAIFFP